MDEYVGTAYSLRDQLERQIGHFHRTRCNICGMDDAHVKYFLWVKTISCQKCREPISLFPGYLLSADSRHPNNVFVCPACGQLTETADRRKPGVCQHCSAELSAEGWLLRNGRCVCPDCSTVNTFPDKALGPPMHRLFAIEYFCPSCRDRHMGRFFKTPDSQDLERHSGRRRKMAPDWRQVRP